MRPSHTYDERLIPTMGHWTDIARMRQGKPVVIHGDGTSLWTITHSDDFAVAFTGLLGNPAAIGEAFTITGTHAPTWNQIYGWLADAAGVAEPDFVHVASDAIAAFAPDLGPGLLGDKAHSVVFDTSKVHGAGPRVPHHDHIRRGRAPDHRALRRAPRRAEGRRGARRAFDRIAAYARSAG